ncbi:MAG: hypothetical protein IKP64_03675 [Selenomonadaceae bacterium]|nr:hypothetical protein [Selenomonadaceae bacterium]MBR4382638.1 hypothetical protein [Selenomonadaceae bacterium]
MRKIFQRIERGRIFSEEFFSRLTTKDDLVIIHSTQFYTTIKSDSITKARDFDFG